MVEDEGGGCRVGKNGEQVRGSREGEGIHGKLEIGGTLEMGRKEGVRTEDEGENLLKWLRMKEGVARLGRMGNR